MGTTRMPTPIRPKKANGKEQNVYWIRQLNLIRLGRRTPEGRVPPSPPPLENSQ